MLSTSARTKILLAAAAAAAAAFLTAGVEAQSRTRAQDKATFLKYQLYYGGATTSVLTVPTTGGSGGVISGPKPTPLSPVDVGAPLPVTSKPDNSADSRL